MGCTYKPDYDNSSSLSFYVKNSRSSAFTGRPRTSVTEPKKSLSQSENDEFLRYLISIGKRKTGLQDKRPDKKPPSEFMGSYNLNHPDLNKGQRLYLNDLCRMYSVNPLKQSKQVQYLKLYQKQKDIGNHFIKVYSVL